MALIDNSKIEIQNFKERQDRFLKNVFEFYEDEAHSIPLTDIDTHGFDIIVFKKDCDNNKTVLIESNYPGSNGITILDHTLTWYKNNAFMTSMPLGDFEWIMYETIAGDKEPILGGSFIIE